MNNGCPILHFLFTSDVLESVPFRSSTIARLYGLAGFHLEGTGNGNLANTLSEPILPFAANFQVYSIANCSETPRITKCPAEAVNILVNV